MGRKGLRRPRTWSWAFNKLQQEHGQGKLSVDALRRAIQEAGGVRPSRKQLLRIFRKFDRDGNGQLSYEEFEGMLKDMLQIPSDLVMVRRNPAIAQPERYSTTSIWLSTLRNFPSSEVLRDISSPLCWASFGALLTATIQRFAVIGLPGGTASRSLVQECRPAPHHHVTARVPSSCGRRLRA